LVRPVGPPKKVLKLVNYVSFYSSMLLIPLLLNPCCTGLKRKTTQKIVPFLERKARNHNMLIAKVT